ncbi:MAG: heparinase II/III family protein [Chloroflexi bacterium]|nr:heparinase II/III family protein [Chloroflexota bacterium]
MIKTWEKIFRGLFSEGVVPEHLYSKRSRNRGIPCMNDREFFWSLNLSSPYLAEIAIKVDSHDYDGATDTFINYLRKRTLPMFMPNYTAREYILDQANKFFPRSGDKIILRAQRALHNVFMLPVMGEINFGSAPDWFTDFSGGTRLYGHVAELQDIFTGDEYLSTLPTWELNNHLHLQDLGRAYWLTGEEEFTHAFIYHVNDWIERNPVNMGVNWLESDFMAQRAISWMTALGYFLPSDQFDTGFFLKFMKSLLMHSACLYERAKSRKNVTSPAPYAALYMMGFLFPEFRSAQRYRKTGEAGLADFCRKIIGETGATARGSFMRMRWELGICLYPMLLAALHGETMPEIFEERLESGLNFILNALEPDGSLPLVGEAWPGGVFTPGGSPDHEAHILLSLGSIIFDSPQMKRAGIRGISETVWFCGRKDWEKYLQLDEMEPRKFTLSAPEEGIFMSRTSWTDTANRILFRNLPRKKPVQYTHHDQLQFLLTIGGEPVMTDSGSGAGTVHDKKYLASIRAHNIISIPHMSQETDTIMKLSHGGKPAPPFMATMPEQDFFTGGYITETEDGRKLNIRRRIIFDKKHQWVVLEDSIDGEGSHPVDLYFHLHPKVEVVVRGDLGCLMRVGKVQARLTCYFPGKFKCEIVKGESSPPGGWYTDGTGKIYPSTQLRYYARENLPLTVYTWIGWSPTDFKTPTPDEMKFMFTQAERMSANQARKEKAPPAPVKEGSDAVEEISSDMNMNKPEPPEE